MFNIKDAICVGGNPSKPCEDAIGYNDSYAFAIDGASVLSGVNIVDERSDAAWFATQIKDHLCRHLDKESQIPTAVLLAEIIGNLKKDYFRVAADKGLDIPSDSPSAGIALFRQVGDEIEFFGLGDCTGVIEFTDGTVEVLKDTRLCALDGTVLAKMAELHQETGIPVLQAREACNDLLLINRNKRNKDGGYWILDLSGVGIDHGLTYRWPVNSVKRVFACSDGFAQLVETFGIYKNYAALLDAVRHEDLQTLCGILFAAQDSDPNANTYPRFKLRDDTCCLWGEIE